jgi:hypothetical protein
MNYNSFRTAFGKVKDRPMVQAAMARVWRGKGLPLQGPGLSLEFLKHHDVLPPILASSALKRHATANQKTQSRQKEETSSTNLSCEPCCGRE